MHGFDDIPRNLDTSPATGPWYKELNGYHWFVLTVAALGWLFDCLDQQLFILARQPAMRDLLPGTPSQATIDEYGGYATAIFLMGWGIGGLIFGVMGDRIGRAKTMMITILMYSMFTGLSAISQGFGDFVLYRFLTGMGVGGEFAVGVALVAEVMPDRARPYCLSVLQALSAIGNISAAFIGMGMGKLEQAAVIDSGWRLMFVIGAGPALLALVIRWRLKEPERWQQASHEGDIARKLGSYRELFSHPLWRKHALLGLGLAFAGIVGLWGVGFYTFDLVGNVLKDRFVADVVAEKQADPDALVASLANVFPADEAAALAQQKPAAIALALSEKQRELSAAAQQKNAGEKKESKSWLTAIIESFSAAEKDKEVGQSTASEQQKSVLSRVLTDDEVKMVNGDTTFWKSIASMMMNIGAALGMYGFAVLAQRIGRKPTFAICFIAALLSTAGVFYFLTEFHQVFWMIPTMGFCILSLFAGYAIYFPELFPTHLRSTGTSFCYNVGRFVAAVGPALLGWLTGVVYADTASPLRYAGLTMCGIFLLGLFVLPFAPETKDQPLPE